MIRGADIALVGVALSTVVNLTGCVQENGNNPADPGPPPPSRAAVDHGNVVALCAYVKGFVDSRDHRDALRIRAGRPGVPDDLRAKARAFADEPSNANAALVAWACSNAGA